MRVCALLVLGACAAKSSPVPADPQPYPHAGYMETIRRRVNDWWQENLDALPSSVRLSRASYMTEVNVVLDADGALESIVVSVASGSAELDDAVVRAFQLASPFDDPPDGLVANDGKVYLPEFDFTVQLSDAALARQRPPP